MKRSVSISLLLALGAICTAGYVYKTKTSKLPERPPTFEEIIKLADKNLAANSLIQGYIYSQPDGVGYKKVLERAMTGNTKAELMACYLLTEGIGVKKDKAYGYSLCEKAAKKGSAIAKFNLIYDNFKYDPSHMNWQETYDAFNKLMDEKPGDAHRGFQFLYVQDHPNHSKPKMFYHLKQAIKHGNTNAMVVLSEYDLSPDFAEYKKLNRAEKNLKKAYELNDFDAGLKLAIEYRTGKNLPKDMEKYAAMVKRMANFLHPDSMAELAYMHSNGMGAVKDVKKSNALFVQAAKFGSEYAQGIIGPHLLFGPMETRNYEMGVQYLEARAYNGDKRAMKGLSNHYKRDEIDDPENKHLQWLIAAASIGDEASQEKLGLGMRETGYIKEFQPYIRHLEDGYKVGNIHATYLLARHYRAASGVKRDLRKAREILDKVAYLNDPKTLQEIDIVEGYISHFGGIDAVPDIIKQ